MAETWKIVVTETREAVFYIRGGKESARDDAAVFAAEIEDHEWAEVDHSVDLYPVVDPGPPSGAQVWTGGPQGEWEKA